MYLTGPSQYDSESEGEEEEEVSPQTDVFALTRPATGNSVVTSSSGAGKSVWTADPDLPYVASGYVQLVFNMFLVGVALYIGLAFIRTIQRDVDQKVEEYSAGTSPPLIRSWVCALTGQKYYRRWLFVRKSIWRIVARQIPVFPPWKRPVLRGKSV